MKKKILLLILVPFLFTFCQKLKNFKNYLVNDEVVIALHPFQDFDSKTSQIVLDSLQNYFKEVYLSSPIDFPTHSYNSSRNRYRADSIIQFLKNYHKADTISVGLTNSDISTTYNKVKDWGVMGLGFMPGRACVISTYRLNKTKSNEQLVKAVLHELGHNLGLPHCDNKTCLMRDAKGKNPIDEEKGFCKNCKQKISNKVLIIK